MSSSGPGEVAPGGWIRCDGGWLARGILESRFGPDRPGRRPTRAYPLRDFQEGAVARARRAISTRGGVVVADGVGLGKTYVALALIEEAMSAGEQVAVVVPAALRRTWRTLLRRLDRRSSGSPRLLSHAQLSRGSHRPEQLASCTLVVVDEAHRFRNPSTLRYAALARLCVPARVVLLTATPVNNSPEDLFHLLRLFAADDGFRDIGVASLAEAFERAADAADPDVDPSGDDTSPDVARVVADIVIRRTRADVRNLTAPGRHLFRFPDCAAPVLVRGVGEEAIPAGVVSLVHSLELPGYGGRDQRDAVAALVKLGLLKRLESSRSAAIASLRRHRSFARAFIDAAASGRLLRTRDRGGPNRPADPDQLVLTAIVAEPAPPGVDLGAVSRAARRDLDRLGRACDLLAGEDPKIASLVSLLAGIAHEKVVVFTEYRATAIALWRVITPRFRAGRVDGSGAWLGSRASGRRAVVERFAPGANGARDPPERERVDVLIATDVLAEGLNLQDARHVVSYDLPWNPVRLLQRIGRIDRLGSPHERVVPYLFAPGPGLDAALRLTGRLRSKLGAIQASVGAEQAAALLDRLGRAEEVARRALDDVDRASSSGLERLRALAGGGAIGRSGAPDPDTASDEVSGSMPGDPPVAWGTLTAGGGAGAETISVLVLATMSGRPWLFEVRGESVREPSHGLADALVAVLGDRTRTPARPERRPASTLAARGEGTGGPSRRYTAEPPPRIRAAAQVVARHLAGTEATLDRPIGLARGSAPARVAARLRRALTVPGTVPTPRVLARAERVLERLAVPLSPVPAAAIRDLAEEPGSGTSAAELLDRIEAALGPDSGAAPQRRERGLAPRILAVLAVQKPARPAG